MRRNAVLSAAVALMALTVALGDARAQGFGVYEHDACVMARSGTGVAAPCSGGSAIFFNPAGIVGSPTRWNAQLGGTLITLDFTFRDSVTGDTTPTVAHNIPVPAAYITRQFGDRFAAGVGVYAPYGLIVEWPTTFSGRFLAYKSDLKTIYVQPTVAYRLRPNLRLGAGLTVVHSIVKLNQRVDLSSQNTTSPGVTFAMLGVPVGTDFADANVEGTANNFSGHFGILWDVTPRISIGARYLMGMTANLSGTANFTQVPTGITLPAGNPLGAPGGTPMDAVLAPQFTGSGSLVSQDVTADIPLPDQLVVGVAVRPMPNLTLLFDWQMVDWKDFEQLPLTFAKLNAGQPSTRTLNEDYVATNGYRFGVDYQATPRLALRGGYLFHEAAAPAQTVTPLLPEGERTEFTAGLGLQLSGRIRFDVAYQRIRQQDRRGRVVEPPVRGPAGASVNSGLYAGTANLFGASFAFGF